MKLYLNDSDAEVIVNLIKDHEDRMTTTMSPSRGTRGRTASGKL